MIYKYPLHSSIALCLPKDSKMLDAAYQGKQLFLWVLLGTGPNTHFKFDTIGTGWDTPTDGKTYLKTVHQNGFPWHIFYKEEE